MLCLVYFALGRILCTELIQRLELEYPRYRLSDTVLYAALKFLEDERAIVGYWKKVEGRGRPRRMYQVSSQWQDEAQKLAALWMNSATKQRKSAVAAFVV